MALPKSQALRSAPQQVDDAVRKAQLVFIKAMDAAADVYLDRKDTANYPAELAEKNRRVVEDIAPEFTDRFSQEQLAFIYKLLGMLPIDSDPLLVAITDHYFAASAWTDFVNGLVMKSPRYVGNSDCELDSCGASSSWTTNWAHNAKASAKWAEMDL